MTLVSLLLIHSSYIYSKSILNSGISINDRVTAFKGNFAKTLTFPFTDPADKYHGTIRHFVLSVRHSPYMYSRSISGGISISDMTAF